VTTVFGMELEIQFIASSRGEDTEPGGRTL
jgi:hypothetical protein